AVLELDRQPAVVALELPAPAGDFLPDGGLVALGGAVAFPVADVLLQFLQRFLGIAALLRFGSGNDVARGRQQQAAQQHAIFHGWHPRRVDRETHNHGNSNTNSVLLALAVTRNRPSVVNVIWLTKPRSETAGSVQRRSSLPDSA